MVQTNKKLVYEVSYIRPIVIFLLVLMHSFSKIEVGGMRTNDYQLCDAYQWLVWLVSGFRIETIALVAGYIYAFQCLDLGRSYPFKQFLKKKFKRLIVPMLFFGTIYYFCFFFNEVPTFTIGGFIKRLLSGCGHLWFLPMLFWCFLAIWAINRYHLSSWKLFIALALIAVAPIPSIPFGFSRLPHFLFFVYAGYYLWEKRGYILRLKDNNKVILGLWLIYICIVVVRHTLFVNVFPNDNLINKVLNHASLNIIGIPMSCCGIIALYLTVCHYTMRDNFVPPQWVIDASNTCYGIYVYHQFILVWLYFYTPFVQKCPNLFVPWIGFVVTFVVSLVLTKLTLKTKFGRSLIG